MTRIAYREVRHQVPADAAVGRVHNRGIGEFRDSEASSGSARTPQELLYFGPLQKVPNALLEKHLVFSRIPGADKEYVQDRMRTEGKAVADILKSPATHMYICGLKDMETGIDEALADICRKHGLALGLPDWAKLKPELRSTGRFHVETY